MNASVMELGEVIIVGYGTQEKRDVSGSIGSIKREDFELQPVIRADQILQGRVPGVNVTNQSGAPGGAVSIRIRGANSILGSNEPLFVIDGFVGASFEDVTPADIEDIQVLKDASATAIYGSRGANGVVLINTSTGNPGKSKLSFSARYFNSRPMGKYDLMDAATFAETYDQRAVDLGAEPEFGQDSIEYFRLNGGTDWQDEIFRMGHGQEYQLDYAAGEEDVTYFISGNFLNQDGIILNSNFKRYALRANLRARIKNNLGTILRLSFTRRLNQGFNGSNRIMTSPMVDVLMWAPTTPVYDENGMFIAPDPLSQSPVNPVERAMSDNIVESNTVFANGSLDWKIVPGLILDIGLGLSYRNKQGKLATDFRAVEPVSVRASDEFIFLQNTNNLTFSKVFNNIHALTITGVLEHQMQQSDAFHVQANRVLYPGLKYYNITLAESSSQEASKAKQTIRSFIGRINYTLNDKYLFAVTVRSDGSSKFRGANRYGTFPSVALGWRISREHFLNNGFFHDLKVRFSWGETGNQAIPPYGTLATFLTSDFDASTSFNNGTLNHGIIIGDPGNPSLSWETTTQWNVGLDAEVFKGKLGLVLDYFNKITTDLLLDETLPSYTGGGIIYRNLGEVANKGIEVALSSSISSSWDLHWRSSLNFTFAENEVKNLGDRSLIYQGSYSEIIKPGHSLSNYYAYRYLGTWKEGEAELAKIYNNVIGDARYEDYNQDSVLTTEDYQILGSSIPTTLFGWNNTLQWRNFSLNLFFQGMAGYKKGAGAYSAAMSDAVTHRDLLDRWDAVENPTSDIPHFSQSSRSEFSSRFLYRGDFIRLKNLSFSYLLDRNVLKWFDATLSISGLNLWTLTNYKGLDPEASTDFEDKLPVGADWGAYPNAKTWVFGIKLNF
jgi:TonB-linked SusC/RagA family outer membrane protein